MPENLNSQSFAKYLRTAFQVRTSESDRAPLELIEVHDLNYSPKLEQFSLIFVGALTPALPQRLYDMEHEHLGSLQLFLVPLGPDSEGKRMRYEAAFNRFRREGA